MSKWVLGSGGPLDYPTLGFRANTGQILSASAAPDGRWSLNGDQGAAETVTRYTIGGDPSYVEPGDGHVLTWSDADNAYVPTARSVFVEEDVDTPVAENIADPESATATALSASYVYGVSATQAVMRKLENDEDVNIVIASDSTDNAVDEWGALLGGLLGDDYLTHDVLWHPIETDGTAYDTPTSLQTGSGSGTIHIWNNAVAGWNSWAWQGPNFAAQFVTPSPDLVLIVTGHNETIFTADPGSLGQPAVQFRLRVLAVTEQIRQELPHTQIALVAQHGWLDGTGDMAEKRDELRLIAQARGYGFVDMYQAWSDAGTPSGWYSDNIHINATGEAFYATTIHGAFRYDPKWEPRPQPPSLFDESAARNIADDLLMPASASAPVGWTAANATVTRDTTNYESGRGYGIRVLQTAPSTPSRIYRSILDATTVVPWRGQWVLVAARMIRPAAGTANRHVGLISVSDGVNLSRTYGDDYTEDGFVWRLIPHYIDPSATVLNVSLWADELGNPTFAANPDTTWDRFMIIPGQWPKGGFGRGGLRQIRNAERYETLYVGQADSTGTGTIEFDSNAPTTTSRGDIVSRVAGVARWIVRFSGTEAGSNTGTDLQFFARDDSGNALATAFTLVRRYGQAKFAAYATGSRPVASSAGAGAVLFDSTLNRPIWSDASTWHAAGSYLTATATLDFPSIAAAGQQELTITVTGAAVGDCVVLGPPAALEAGVQATGYVSATNTVKIRLSNVTGSAVDPASATWRASILR